MDIHWTDISRIKNSDKGACCYRFVSCKADAITGLLLNMIDNTQKTKHRKK